VQRVPWRIRVAAVTGPALLLMLSLVAFSGRADPPSAPTVPEASETRCLPIEPVRSVPDLNRLVTQVRGSGAFQGADVGADVTLQDGRRLWLFGDTLRSADFDGQRFVRNSMLVFEPGCAQVVLPADHGALIPDRADGVGYWPMSVAKIERPGYDLVGVSAQRVKGADAPDGPLAFDNLGPAVALFVVERGRTPQLLGVRDVGPDDDDPRRPTWGAATAVSDGWVYLYGTARPGRGLVFGFSLHVARVRPDDVLRPDRYRYWNGRAWTRDASDLATLVPAEGGVSQTLSVFERGGRWYAVSKRDEFLGKDLVVWSASRPTGPFTPSAPVAQIPSEPDGRLRYMPLAHPDLLPERGSVVVSYSQNDTDLAEVARDPFVYRPRFLRIPLPR